MKRRYNRGWYVVSTHHKNERKTAPTRNEFFVLKEQQVAEQNKNFDREEEKKQYANVDDRKVRGNQEKMWSLVKRNRSEFEDSRRPFHFGKRSPQPDEKKASSDPGKYGFVYLLTILGTVCIFISILIAIQMAGILPIIGFVAALLLFLLSFIFSLKFIREIKAGKSELKKWPFRLNVIITLLELGIVLVFL
jgi:hypothetical protein